VLGLAVIEVQAGVAGGCHLPPSPRMLHVKIHAHHLEITNYIEIIESFVDPSYVALL
jgi:hypothetical protein